MATFLEGLWGCVAIPVILLALLLFLALMRIIVLFVIPVGLLLLGGWLVDYGMSHGEAGFVGLGLFIAALGVGGCCMVVWMIREGDF